MARLVFCPKCGTVHITGARCPNDPRRKRRPTPADAGRAVNEPWRRAYGTQPYLRARQAVIERQGGRCADCGKACASKKNGRWTTAKGGGEVDHEVALCEGGSNDPSNLTLRCRSCHAKRDAKRRREGRR